MGGLGVGAVVYDDDRDRQGVVIDASPLRYPQHLVVRWEPLEADETSRLHSDEFRQAPRYSPRYCVVVPCR